MARFITSKYLLLGIVAVAVFYAFSYSFSSDKIDFNTQVKPLLNKKCITCHGGVKRQGDFSLLFRQDALAVTKSGKPAIIPFDPEGSEMIKRLTHADPEERMPYKQDPLSKNEIQILTQWVKEGAEWGDHWAYTEVQPVPLPTIKGSFWGLVKPDWVQNGVDYFILDKIKQAGLTPSVKADKPTLLRRVALDLTGLPPSESLRQQFLADNSEKAYENLVDSLLASPNYGEKWTSMWLDMARYADTKGYERDDSRSIWRYRDWLIRAFNEDKPYNEFITEQIAGDLLPNPTDAQYIATAFHRNTMTNDEGGTDNEEFRIAAVMDRVNTTWQGIMGTTFACVQCHSHPYDPFRHEDYYKFMAFFNDSRDEDTHGDYPVLREFRKQDSLTYLELNGWLKTHVPQRAAALNTFVKTLQPSYNSLTADKLVNSALADEKWLALRQNGSARFKKVALDGRNQLIYAYSSKAKGGKLTIYLDSLPQGVPSAKGTVLTSFPIDTSKGGWSVAKTMIPPTSGVHDLYFFYSNPNLKKPTETGLTFDWLSFTEAFPTQNLPNRDSAEKHFWQLLEAKDFDRTPIMMENPADMHRTTHVFERGNWLTPKEAVNPEVPASLHPFPANAPKNRRGLAMWLTDTRNPLTARTYVNRLWEQIFGVGLAETLEDLGTQGIPPTHRDLLDYLSYELMHGMNWQTKKLLKTLVMSATYQQTSVVSPELQAKDPQNKLYARAPRVRLSAEQLRDQVLAVSGLLLDSLYGKSVFPFQPEGIWSSPWNGQTWKKSEGRQQYRRALYTYWKRSSPFPSMLTFDGVNREVCVSRRIRTNTPLQALVTLNDSTYLAAAVTLAKNAASTVSMTPLGEGVSQQIAQCYEKALGYTLAPNKRQVLETLYQKSLQQFTQQMDKGKGKSPHILSEQPPQIAALAVVANAILNLDEFVNKS
ncbi:MAG: DUF1549 domain-containing protein [Saprospiraceae bacterium]|nr:DUF1549 domain-containing protein [Saprospiraceae bacterium]